MGLEQLTTISNSLDGIAKSIAESGNYDVQLTIISILINAVLAIVVIIQLLLYRNEINSRLRPWIGASKGGFDYDKNKNVVVFSYDNYGQMAANSVLEKWNISDKINSRENVIKNVKGKNIKSVTFPNHARRFSFEIMNNPIVQKAIKDKKSFYLEITIEYEFGKNKKGFYGLIGEYEVNGNGIVIDEWTT